jgi:hypothetical protein
MRLGTLPINECWNQERTGGARSGDEDWANTSGRSTGAGAPVLATCAHAALCGTRAGDAASQSTAREAATSRPAAAARLVSCGVSQAGN